MSAVEQSREYVYGPAVSVQTDIAEKYKPIEIDFEAISKNLARDFPELTQEDWDKVLIHIIDFMPDNIVGIAIDIKSLKELSLTRVGRKYKSKVLTSKKQNLLEEGKDVLVQVIPYDTSVKTAHPFDRQLVFNDGSIILAHELKHAADILCPSLDQDSLMREFRTTSLKHSKLGGAYLAFVAITGIGVIETIVSNYNFGIPEVVGGLIVSNYLTSEIAKNNISLAKTIKLKSENNENVATAYTLATESTWSNVIASGRQAKNIKK